MLRAGAFRQVLDLIGGKRLFDDGTLTLAQAAKVAGVSVETFIERVGAAGLTVVRTPADELDSELEVIAQHGRSR